MTEEKPREWTLFRRHGTKLWSVAPDDGFIWHVDNPEPESIVVVPKSAYQRLQSERDEYIKRYQSIERANKELTRNDHVNFGKLIQERDALKAQAKHLRFALSALANKHPCNVGGDCHCETCVAKHALSTTSSLGEK